MTEQLTQIPQEQPNTETVSPDNALIPATYAELSPFARRAKDKSQLEADDTEQAKWDRFAAGGEQTRLQQPAEAGTKH